jgi:hypothetical protein
MKPAVSSNVYIGKESIPIGGAVHMLWWIIGIAVVFGVISGLLRRKFSQNTFEAGNQNERQLQEEERVKASSWFNGGQ